MTQKTVNFKNIMRN